MWNSITHQGLVLDSALAQTLLHFNDLRRHYPSLIIGPSALHTSARMNLIVPSRAHGPSGTCHRQPSASPTNHHQSALFAFLCPAGAFSLSGDGGGLRFFLMFFHAPVILSVEGR